MKIRPSISEQADSHAVILGVCIFHDENIMMEQRWSGLRISEIFLDCGTGFGYVWIDTYMLLNNGPGQKMSSKASKQREQQMTLLVWVLKKGLVVDTESLRKIIKINATKCGKAEHRGCSRSTKESGFYWG
jgi:hypothetical protein